MLTGTANFRVSEALDASGGSIPPQYADNAQKTLEVMQAIRSYLGRPITITSLYRSSARNEATSGASSTSQHLQALAADFDVSGMTNHEATAAILRGINEGRIPRLHEIITYETDHHVHIGIAAGGWLADMKALVKTATGYVQLTESKLASLVGSGVSATVKAVGQAPVTAVGTLAVIALLLIALRKLT